MICGFVCLSRKNGQRIFTLLACAMDGPSVDYDHDSILVVDYDLQLTKLIVLGLLSIFSSHFLPLAFCN